MNPNNLLSRSPQTQLLLYDYNAVTVLDDQSTSIDDHEMHMMMRYGHRRSPYAHVTHGPILPLQLAAAVNQYDDTLYRFCHSLSHQFTRRYFHLHDLDYSESAIKAVKGFPSELGSPNYILVMRAAPLGHELPEPHRPPENTYGSLNEG